MEICCNYNWIFNKIKNYKLLHWFAYPYYCVNFLKNLCLLVGTISKCHFFSCPQNFECSYLFQIKCILRMWGQYFIALKTFFPTMYRTSIKPHLTPTFKGGNLVLVFSFNHNSCKSGLIEQCEGILSMYDSRPF